MGNKQIQKWLASAGQFDVPDGDYPVLCVLEMEPPTRGPQEVKSERTVRIENGYIDLNEAYEAAGETASQVGPGFDTVVGAAVRNGVLQLIIVWEHEEPSSEDQRSH